MIAAVLLAAGQASRYGGSKLLESYQGETLLRRAARALSEAGCAPVLVVLPPAPGPREQLDGLAVRGIENRHPERGIAHSIALGVAALPADAEAALIAVADQPLLSAHVVRRLVEAFEPGRIVAPRYGQTPGNPRIYDRRFFAELTRLAGDRGGHLLAARHPEAVTEVSFPARYGVDIDTPADWKRIEGPDSSER